MEWWGCGGSVAEVVVVVVVVIEVRVEVAATHARSHQPHSGVTRLRGNLLRRNIIIRLSSVCGKIYLARQVSDRL